MKPSAVTFDCAETLVRVNWSVGGFALDCCAHIGLDIPRDAGDLYKGMYYERLPQFLQVNLTRDVRQGEQFWLELGRDWLRAIGKDEALAEKLQAASDELGFGPDSLLFSLFDDVIPCLDQLKAEGVRLAVISNWDYSLHRTLRVMGIHDYFEVVLASLEEGWEKPDRRLFDLALEKLGLPASEVVHVGDNPLDDLEGAEGAGMRGVLIDRNLRAANPPAIHTLHALPEAFAWSA